jgi:50S ribosomal subunit-associated GTPase HflX
VEAVLESLNVTQTPRLLVWSKIDTAAPEHVRQLVRLYGGTPVSAISGENLETLLLTIERALWKPGRPVLAAGRPARARLAGVARTDGAERAALDEADEVGERSADTRELEDGFEPSPNELTASPEPLQPATA